MVGSWPPATSRSMERQKLGDASSSSTLIFTMRSASSTGVGASPSARGVPGMARDANSRSMPV